MDSDLNGAIPQFTLTCICTGGPATTVTWTRDSTTVTEGTETVLNDPVTAQYTHTSGGSRGVPRVPRNPPFLIHNSTCYYRSRTAGARVHGVATYTQNPPFLIPGSAAAHYDCDWKTTWALHLHLNKQQTIKFIRKYHNSSYEAHS